MLPENRRGDTGAVPAVTADRGLDGRSHKYARRCACRSGRLAAIAGAAASLRNDGTMLRVDIEDDGRVTFPLREGHGLTGMRERIDALGGSLRIDRAARGGVRIQASLPT